MRAPLAPCTPSKKLNPRRSFMNAEMLLVSGTRALSGSGSVGLTGKGSVPGGCLCLGLSTLEYRTILMSGVGVGAALLGRLAWSGGRVSILPSTVASAEISICAQLYCVCSGTQGQGNGAPFLHVILPDLRSSISGAPGVQEMEPPETLGACVREPQMCFSRCRSGHPSSAPIDKNCTARSEPR